MGIAIQDFWHLAVVSGLLTSADCERLHAEFRGLKGAAQQASTTTLAQWLVANGTLTDYQASVLLAGRPGPFIFGDFIIRQRIDSGRLAGVFRALFKGKPVLLLFGSQLAANGRDMNAVVAHSAAAAKIKSPHVYRVHGATAVRSHTFVVVQDLPGQALSELLRDEKLAQAEACRIGFQVALGLAEMHAQGLVHGSVSPENIWIEPSGTAKLLQYPLTPPDTRQLRLALPLVDYVAPEILDPAAVPTPLSDLYGLGCTLYELLAGRGPFAGGTAQQKVLRQAREIPLRLDRVVPQLPEELANLVAKLLEKETMQRAQSAAHVAHLLSPFAAGDTSQRAFPPKLSPTNLSPGYGAWTAPQWQAPPTQTALPQAAPPARPAAQAIPAAQAAPVRSSPRPPKPAEPQEPPQKAIPVNEGAPRQVDSAPEAPAPLAAQAEEGWTPPIVIAEPNSARGTSSPQRGRRPNLLVIALGAAALLLTIAAIAIFFTRSGSKPSSPAAALPAQAESANETPAAESAADETATESAAAPQVSDKPRNATEVAIDDDGKTLWASPTSGGPLTLNYLPSGSQVILALRPAELLANPEGAKLLDALGPGGAWAREQLRAILGVELAAIEQLTVAFYPDETGVPQAAFFMRLAGSATAGELTSQWGATTPARHHEKDFLQAGQYAYYLPEGPTGSSVAVALPAAMREMLELDGSPLVRKGIERLLRHADSQRHLNLLMVPGYLLTDGRDLLAGSLAQVRLPLGSFLQNDFEALLFSSHLGDELFLELRGVGRVEQRPAALTQSLLDRLGRLPEQVESHIASLQPQPYGRLVINRLPRMLSLLSQFTRGAVDGQTAVLRGYLPPSAAHNLVLATELTLAEGLSGGEPLATSAPSVAPAAAGGVAAALNRRTSLSFPRESLDRALETLAKELDVEITILGSDLQLEGITRNQSLNNVELRDQPAGEILRKLLKLANPDDKLVYLIKPGSGGREVIQITTRQAARNRGETLPAEFAENPSK